MHTLFHITVLLFIGCSCAAFIGDSGSDGDRNATQFIDPMAIVTNPCQEVRLAGFICIDCSTLGFCTYMNGAWQTVTMTTCEIEHGFYCSDENIFGCTWQSRCQVPVRGKFYCQQSGIFPDPYDCRSYHDCSIRNEDTPNQCTNGAGYSLLTQSCTLPRESTLCTDKQYECENVGDKGVWAADSSYYYVCQEDKVDDEAVLYPLMFKCQSGYIFNGHLCVKESSRQLLTNDDQVEICENGHLYKGNTPQEYSYCHNGVLYNEECPVGTYFSEELLMCRHGSAPVMEEPTTDMPDPQTTAATAPTISTNDPIETPSGNCVRTGLAPDLTTCNRFYLCSSANSQMELKSCPSGQIFDLNMYTCVSGSC